VFICSFIITVFLVFCFTAPLRSVAAQSASALTLKAEQHWETYGVGGTCINGQHNVFISDVDGDGRQEIVTGGWAYDVDANGTRTSNRAPLKIWSWNGQNISLEASQQWDGNIFSVYASDVDNDGKIEVMTVGNVTDQGSSVATLRFWSWDGHNLLLRGSYQISPATVVCVSDLDGDGKQEVVTLGKPNGCKAQLDAWQWTGENLTLKASTDCCDSINDSANSVAVGDLDNDGLPEIVTAGRVNLLNNSTGQLRLWEFSNGNFSLQATQEWRMVDGCALDAAGSTQGNTVVNNVKVADVDGDGFAEIVTTGFTYDGQKVEAQLKIWNWTSNSLNLETSQQWGSSDITEAKSVAVGDVDGDGKTEVVTSGGMAGYGSFAENATEKASAQLSVWRWDGQTLTLKNSTEWTVGQGVMGWNVAVGDLEDTGVDEVVTVGCMYVGTLCDPDMRIWAMPTVSESGASFSFWVALVAIAAVVIVVLIILMKLVTKQNVSQA